MNTRQKPDPAADTMPSPEVLPQALESADVAVRREAPRATTVGAGGNGGGEGTDCLTDAELLDYVDGRASEGLRSRIQEHIDACRGCYQLVLAAAGHESIAGGSSVTNIEATTFSPGSLVKDRYLIERFVGRGGMGEVYAAFDRLMQKRVALKTLLCTATDDPRAVRKLFAEVLNAQRVGHPHVCRINELQEHQDSGSGRPSVPFFTMEFVEGERLGQRLHRSVPPLSETRIIARQLLEGLQAAHAKGVLHLDFKSDNVMLRGRGSPDAVIMDFGLSRALDSEARMRTSEQHQGAGTLPYMALEQLECRSNLGPPVDVYAFGVVLYEMLTGRLPFQGDSLGAILLKQLRERPAPPSSVVPRLNPLLDAFVLKCLSNDPRQRYANAALALSALDRIEDWEVTPRRRRWLPLAVLALLLGLVGLVAGFGEHQVVLSNRPPAAPVTIAPQKDEPPADERVSRGPTLSPPTIEDIPSRTSPELDPRVLPAPEVTPTAPGKPAQGERQRAAESDTTSSRQAPRTGATKTTDTPRAASATRFADPPQDTPAHSEVAAPARPAWAQRLGRPLPFETPPASPVPRSSPDSGR